MKKAMYPGTFDPITIGHVDVIERAAAQVDELHVVIATNVNKKVSFSVEEEWILSDDQRLTLTIL